MLTSSQFDTLIEQVQDDPAKTLVMMCQEYMPEVAVQLGMLLPLVPVPQLKAMTSELVSAFQAIRAGRPNDAVAIANNYGLGDAMRGWIARLTAEE